ncbi:hypothetical protein SDC9_127900 [bioreactor metagenome]|uniref:Uncharacterized protein n=1 Tax=bioreactor metagenome TaxID=1076179 RepID=A0A645CVD1_9ZZZZ
MFFHALDTFLCCLEGSLTERILHRHHLVDEGNEIVIAGSMSQTLVELRIAGSHRLDVPSLCGGSAFLQQAFQRFQLFISDDLRGKIDRHTLQGGTDILDVLQVVAGKTADDRSRPGNNHQKALGLQNLERFLYRGCTDPKNLAQGVDGNLLTRTKLTAKNPLANLIGNLG